MTDWQKHTILGLIVLVGLSVLLGPPLICHYTTPMYKLYTIQAGDTTAKYETTNPDSLIMAETRGWSEKHIREVKWVKTKCHE